MVAVHQGVLQKRQPMEQQYGLQGGEALAAHDCLAAEVTATLVWVGVVGAATRALERLRDDCLAVAVAVVAAAER